MNYVAAALAAALIVLPLVSGRAETPGLCVPLSTIAKHGKLTLLKPGQANFAAGIYAGVPPVGQPAPQHDGVSLFEDGDDHAALLFTQGKQLCVQPFVIPESLVDLIKGVKTAKGETAI